MYDIKIRGGTVVDGTGGPSRTADVGVVDGRIVEVGDLSGPAHRTLDADGALVTPGFTDIHTHYDGQASWDADLAPSIWHGVTTMVMGNCGVGFAPVRPSDHDRLVALMEGVEDIPGTALSEGLTWEWETFPEYLDALDRVGHTADLVCHVPHDALRVYVMGERAVSGSEATDEDIDRMRQAVADALDAGAVGFSTGRSDTHRSASGGVDPSVRGVEARAAGDRPGLRGAHVGGAAGGQRLRLPAGRRPVRRRVRFCSKPWSTPAGGDRSSVSVLQRDQVPDQWIEVFARLEAMSARGLSVRGQVAPRAIGVMLGLDADVPSVHGLSVLQGDRRVAPGRSRPGPAGSGAPGEDPRRAVHAGGRRRQQAPRDRRSTGSPTSRCCPPRIFRLGDPPNYQPRPADSLAAEAARRGLPLLGLLYDALLEDEGKSLLYFPLLNYTSMDLGAVRRMLTHPLALPGLSDGGAHVGSVCDASFPTFLLSYWGRDRGEDGIALEQLVRMQARDTARHLGLVDRGEIRPGQRADLNVIDLPNLGLERPVLWSDLPAGGKRLMQRARGIRTTMVAGQVVAEDGELTGRRPGRVARIG